MDGRWKVSILGLLMVCALSGHLQAQTTVETGEFLTDDGRLIQWERVSTYYRIKNSTVYFEKPQREQVIEGAEGELVTSDGDLPGHPNTRMVAYDTLRRARDQLRGLFRPQSESWSIHLCDNPDCEFEYRKEIAEAGYTKRVAGWSIGTYATYLNRNPEDWLVMREFSIAASIFNDLRIASEVMQIAYLNDPGLAAEPIDMEFLGIDERMTRDLVVKSVKQAHRDGLAQSWLMVAVLMQSEGRLERAAEMLDRAIDAGLDETVAEHMKEALQ